MRFITLVALMLVLASCYTKQQALRKFCVNKPITIDTSFHISGVVDDSLHKGSFTIIDSCNLFKNMYDSLVNSGKFVIDTSVNINHLDSTTKNNNSRASKWAVLYTDSVFVIRFRITSNGKAQFDVEKLARKIPYTAPVNFKTVVNQPCPKPEPLPWWHNYLTWLFGFLVMYFCTTLFVFFFVIRR